jgi:hypothetical protein
LNIKDFLNALDMSDGYKDGRINAKVGMLENFVIVSLICIQPCHRR